MMVSLTATELVMIATNGWGIFMDRPPLPPQDGPDGMGPSRMTDPCLEHRLTASYCYSTLPIVPNCWKLIKANQISHAAHATLCAGVVQTLEWKVL